MEPRVKTYNVIVYVYNDKRCTFWYQGDWNDIHRYGTAMQPFHKTNSSYQTELPIGLAHGNSKIIGTNLSKHRNISHSAKKIHNNCERVFSRSGKSTGRFSKIMYIWLRFVHSLHSFSAIASKWISASRLLYSDFKPTLWTFRKQANQTPWLFYEFNVPHIATRVYVIHGTLLTAW